MSSRRIAARLEALEKRRISEDTGAGAIVEAVDTTNTLLTGIDTVLDSIEAQDTAGLNISAGRITGTSAVHKFGANLAIPNSFTPVTRGGVYPMVLAAAATTLRIKAGGNAADTAAGAGAREITLQGLDETGAEVSEAVATAGASASSSTTATFIRVYRAWVSASGTYATPAGGSHVADIVIEDTAGTQDWGTIPLNGFGMAQSTIAAYTVPLGKTAYMQSWLLQVDSNKTVDFMFYVRENILEAAAPFSGYRMKFGAFGVADNISVKPHTPAGPFPALTDLVWMAKVATGTGIAAADFELIIE